MINNKVNRINMLKAVFDKDKQRPTAIEIHQWIAEKLKVRESQLQTLQLVGKENAVYLKFVNCVRPVVDYQIFGPNLSWDLITIF